MIAIEEAIMRARAYMDDGSEGSAARSIIDAYSLEVERALSELHLVAPCFDKDAVIHYTGLNILYALIHKRIDPEEELARDKTDTDNVNVPLENNDCFRLYDTLHANDPDEGRYINRHWPEGTKWIWRTTANSINSLGTSDTLENATGAPNHYDYAYYISFVRADKSRDMADNLVFWRTYGREGEGCAIQIPLRQFILKDSCGNLQDNTKLPLYEVLYGQKGVSKLMAFFEDVLRLVNEALSTDLSSIGKGVIGSIQQQMNVFRYLYKSDAYDYEKECRLVIPGINVSPREVHYEEKPDGFGGSRIRHYLLRGETGISDFLVTDSSIVIGPCVNHTSNVVDFVNTMLKRWHLSGPDVRLSNIQYRKN